MSQVRQQKPRKAPTLRRWQIGQQLRILREAAGIPAYDAARRLRCVEGKIYHLETGRTLIRPAELEVLLTLYGALDRLEVLDTIRAEANQKGWWTIHKQPPWLNTYLGLEDGATSISRFTQELVPGMLQTEEYARALNSLPGVSLPDPENDRNVAARLERGSHLLSDDFKLSVVMSEALLSRSSYIPNGIGVKQLRRILHAMELPNVTIQMLPFSVGLHQSMEKSFTLLEFPEYTLDTVAYQSFNDIAAVVDKRDVVQQFETCYAELTKLALDPTATAVEIEEFIKETEKIP
jgi:transcriptional regulator with XRE-family HTH domain